MCPLLQRGHTSPQQPDTEILWSKEQRCRNEEQEGEIEVGTSGTVATVALQKCWEMPIDKNGEKEDGGFCSEQCAASWSGKKLERKECFVSD